MLAYNERIDVRLYRISSQIVPFASHPVNQVAWWEEEADLLSLIGRQIQRTGTRCSMHPGQYTLLNSPSDDVTSRAIDDLRWHNQLLDSLGLGPDHKLVIHIGGVYGEKAEAMERFCRRYRDLPEELRRRLVIENDDRLFSAADALSLHDSIGLPVVFDGFHDSILPSEPDSFSRAAATWGPEDGPPKVHFSSQAPGQRPGAHADDVDGDEFETFLRSAPDVLFDCMLESKRKDLSLLELRASLRYRGLGEVDPA